MRSATPRHARRSNEDGARSPGDARGQALLEFALILPVLLMVLLLAVDFGRLFFTYVAVNNAAREATFVAAVEAADADYEEDEFEDAVEAAAAAEANVQVQGGEGSLTVSELTCFSPATSTTKDCHAAADFAGGIGNQVTVTVSQPFTFLTPLIGDVFGGQLVMTASATGPVLNPLDATLYSMSVPTASPSASPSPTASPTATPSGSCTVPDFYHTYWADPDALHTWRVVAGFSGTLTDATGGKKIQRQTLVAGTSVSCASSMTVSDH